MKLHRFSVIITALVVSLAASPRSRAAEVTETRNNPYAPLNYRPAGSYGQAIVDMEMAKHPEIKLINIHTTPIGVDPKVDEERRILCSTVGRIGKHSGKTDWKTFHSGKGSLEFFKTLDAQDPIPWSPQAAPKYGMIEHLIVGDGTDAGLIFIVFHWQEGDDPAVFRKKADEILAEFKARIQTKDDLLKPAPWPSS